MAKSTLQESMMLALGVKDTVSKSRVTRADNSIVEVRNRRQTTDAPLFVHCVSYMPGRQGSVVPKVDEKASEAPLATVAPPEDSEFLDGSCVALISGDHAIFCGHNMKIEAFRVFLHELARQAGRPLPETQYDFAPVADRALLRKLQAEGVRSIGIDASLDDYDPNEQMFETLYGQVKNRVLDALRSLIEKDSKFSDLKEADYHNINAKIVLSLDKRFISGVSQEDFDKTAQQAINSSEPGFYLRTRDNSIITSSSIKLCKSVDLPNKDESLDHSKAWVAMEEYLDELRTRGYLNE